MRIRSILHEVIARPYICISYGAALGLTASVAQTADIAGQHQLAAVAQGQADVLNDLLRGYVTGCRTSTEMVFGSQEIYAQQFDALNYSLGRI